MPKKGGILVDQRIGAGTRGYDHIIIRIERLDNISGDINRAGPVTAIQRRLAAATLLTWDPDATPCPLKQGDRGKSNLRTHQVSKTGHEQPNVDGQLGFGFNHDESLSDEQHSLYH